MAYLVIEIQTFDNGHIASNQFGFDDTSKTDEQNRNEAEAKMHYLLSLAATSTLPKYGVALLDQAGSRLNGGCYVHGAAE